MAGDVTVGYFKRLIANDFLLSSLTAKNGILPVINGGTGVSYSGPLSPAVRQVATACCVPNFNDASAANWMARSAHIACDDINAISIVTPWFYMTSSSIETAPGSAPVIAVWVEYPTGTFTQMTYSGSLTGTLPNGGMLTSDMITLGLRIPRNARFFVWHRVISGTAGRVLCSMGAVPGAANGGEGIINGGQTGTSTPQNCGSIGDISTTTTFRPIAILASTSRRSFLIKCDSRGYVGDARSKGYSDVGEVCKGLGSLVVYANTAPYINIAMTGDSLTSFVATTSGQRANTVALSAYVTDVIMQVGINDLTSGVSLATMQTNYTTAFNFFPGKNKWLTTKGPVTTSTDNWATLVNQSTVASNAVRITLNNWVRSNSSGYTGFFELADPIESARDSGKWAVTGIAFGYCTDGTHASPAGFDLTRDGGFATGASIQ